MNISAEGAIGATVNEGGPAGSDGAVGDDEPLQPAGKDVSRHRTAAAMKVRIAVAPGSLPVERDAYHRFIDGLEGHGFDTVWLSDVPLGRVVDPFVGLAIAAASIGGVAVGSAGTASAANGQGRMATDLNYRLGPGEPSRVLGTIPNGTVLTIECTLTNYSVTGPWGPSNL